MLRQIGLRNDIAEATEEEFDEAVDAALEEVRQKISQRTELSNNRCIHERNCQSNALPMRHCQ